MEHFPMANVIQLIIYLMYTYKTNINQLIYRSNFSSFIQL